MGAGLACRHGADDSAAAAIETVEPRAADAGRAGILHGET
jgi:hypothetical protein